MKAEQIETAIAKLVKYEAELRERQREVLGSQELKALMTQRRRFASEGNWPGATEVKARIDNLVDATNANLSVERRHVLEQIEALRSVTVPTGRKVADIEADMAKLHVDRERVTAQLRALESERNVANVAAELGKLSPAKREAMRQILGAQGIAGAEHVSGSAISKR